LARVPTLTQGGGVLFAVMQGFSAPPWPGLNEPAAHASGSFSSSIRFTRLISIQRRIEVLEGWAVAGPLPPSRHAQHVRRIVDKSLIVAGIERAKERAEVRGASDL